MSCKASLRLFASHQVKESFDCDDVNRRVFVIIRIKECVVEFNQFRLVVKNCDNKATESL